MMNITIKIKIKIKILMMMMMMMMIIINNRVHYTVIFTVFGLGYTDWMVSLEYTIHDRINDENTDVVPTFT